MNTPRCSARCSSSILLLSVRRALQLCVQVARDDQDEISSCQLQKRLEGVPGVPELLSVTARREVHRCIGDVEAFVCVCVCVVSAAAKCCVRRTLVVAAQVPLLVPMVVIPLLQFDARSAQRTCRPEISKCVVWVGGSTSAAAAKSASNRVSGQVNASAMHVFPMLVVCLSMLRLTRCRGGCRRWCSGCCCEPSSLVKVAPMER